MIGKGVATGGAKAKATAVAVEAKQDLLVDIGTELGRHVELVSGRAARLFESPEKILADEGFIDGFEENPSGPQGSIRIDLKYAAGEPGITGLSRVSRPGRRIYRGKSEIPKVLNGLGICIVSTPQGVLTGSACQQKGVGGEVLCSIW